MRFWRLSFPVAVVCILLADVTTAASTQYGRLLVNASPEQAYVFVDGKAIHEASYGDIKLPVGNHKVDIYNYGYKPETRNVTIKHWRTSVLNVSLEPIPGTVSGPWGCIEIEGAPRDAVLLNGKTPEYFVGHGDEFNHAIGAKQELIVPPGTYQLTILHLDKERWSGPVVVDANKRVIIDIPKGVRKTVDWPRGTELKKLPRFYAGIANSQVVVSKPSTQLTLSTADLSCGGSTELSWSTTDAAHVEISNIGPVATSGRQTVQPAQSTDYVITASGPGGTVTSDAQVKVGNSNIEATINATPAEVHYKKIGKDVVQQESATINWTVSNATAVSVDPFGTVDATGSRTLQFTPQKTDPGPVDETVIYKLTATNTCGKTQTQTAMVHVVGSIQPVVASAPEKQLETRLALHSIYFVTAQPPVSNPNGGLILSQQKTLTAIADDFKKYLEYKPDAKLILEGHADPRGSVEYNQALSQRRVESTRHFLVGQGVSESSIEVVASGSQKNLSSAEVKDLIEQDSELTPADKAKILRNLQTIVLANNRRVDETLTTTGEKSARQFPFSAADALNLIGGPVKPAVKKPAVTPRHTAPATTRTPGTRKRTAKKGAAANK